MDFVRLGDSDLNVSKVCLGTMTFGQQNTEAEGHAQLNLALNHGVNFIDTAEMYPVPASADTQGRTEEIVGTWLKTQKREDLVLATKVAGNSSMHWIRGGGKLDSKNIRQALETSLKRLQTDYVDLYQVHWPDRFVPKFGGVYFEDKHYYEHAPLLETLEVMNQLIQEGKIRAFGVSNETPYGLCKYTQLAQQHGYQKPVSIQNAYHLLNRTFEVHLAEVSYHENIPLLAYSPLAFGFLTGKYRNQALPEGSRCEQFPTYAGRYRDKPNAAEAIEAYSQLATSLGLTAMALQFIKSRSFCASIIVGATSTTQLTENLKALEGDLSNEVLKGIDEIDRRFPSPCP